PVIFRRSSITSRASRIAAEERAGRLPSMQSCARKQGAGLTEAALSPIVRLQWRPARLPGLCTRTSCPPTSSPLTPAARSARRPAIGDAFDRGEITWSQARCLVTLATPEDAPLWLLIARFRTVRALEATVARRAGRRVAGDTIDGEERVRVRLPCPRHVRARWGKVLELARCVCGSELAPWHAAEAIAAEGLSARGVEPDDPLAGLPEPRPRPLPEDEGRDVLPALDRAAVEEALPEDVEALRRGAEDLNAFALDRRMR